jgi:hypothetical protein
MTAETVGLTENSGWQVGVRKTLPINPAKAWEFLLSSEMVNLWLGVLPDVQFQRGARFHLEDGTDVKITVLKPNSHLRMRFQPVNYTQPTLIQVRVIPSGENTVFAFHQEQLPDREARQERKYYYQQVLDDLEKILGVFPYN